MPSVFRYVLKEFSILQKTFINCLVRELNTITYKSRLTQKKLHKKSSDLFDSAVFHILLYSCM